MSKLMINLTNAMVAKINEIGRIRSPVEACGIILPFAKPGESSVSQVIELPNRSLEASAYRIDMDDIRIQLGEDVNDPNIVEHLGIWHTHPAGNIGPSGSDMQKRLDGLTYLVVALQEDGTAIPCWF